MATIILSFVHSFFSFYSLFLFHSFILCFIHWYCISFSFINCLPVFFILLFIFLYSFTDSFFISLSLICSLSSSFIHCYFSFIHSLILSIFFVLRFFLNIYSFLLQSQVSSVIDPFHIFFFYPVCFTFTHSFFLFVYNHSFCFLFGFYFLFNSFLLLLLPCIHPSIYWFILLPFISLILCFF